MRENDSDGDWRREAQGRIARREVHEFPSVLLQALQDAGERWMPRYKIWLPLYFLWELSQLLNLSELLSIKLRRVLLPRVVVRTK